MRIPLIAFGAGLLIAVSAQGQGLTPGPNEKALAKELQANQNYEQLIIAYGQEMNEKLGEMQKQLVQLQTDNKNLKEQCGDNCTMPYAEWKKKANEANKSKAESK